ncbi:MAG: hypothetical protein BWY44_01002 [Candidatus Omnitrophica bacterium ADurb.Bin292]|nr:MAG: hypothetical protein BWY44_01002 [Candidatus Omnitrophica bacterium ADurb.Bin292]
MDRFLGSNLLHFRVSKLLRTNQPLSYQLVKQRRHDPFPFFENLSVETVGIVF